MITLVGRQFFAWELAPMLSALEEVLWQAYWDGGSRSDVGAFIAQTNRLKRDVEPLADSDQLKDPAPSYAEGNALWGKANELVKQVTSQVPSLSNAVASLVSDLPAGGPAYPSGTRTMLLWLGGAGLAATIGYFLLRGKR